MLFGFCNVSIAPLRAISSDVGEMVSQLLLGETFIVLEENDKWFKISCSHDAYEGWIDKKQGTIISEEQYELYQKTIHFSIDFHGVAWHESERTIVPLGAPLHQFDLPFFELGNAQYEFEGEWINLHDWKDIPHERLIAVAQRYLNAPYLWGGRTPYGIDCSGFTQMIMRFANVKLPRDAWQQAICGEETAFEDIQPGDLAFFKNAAGRVVHVGLLIDNQTIIHASGKVRIDSFSKEGIYNKKESTHSHNLHCIRRVRFFS